jgi:hypothetical protein
MNNSLTSIPTAMFASITPEFGLRGMAENSLSADPMTEHHQPEEDQEPVIPEKMNERRFDPWERVRRLNEYVEKRRQEARDRAKVSTEIWDGVDRNYFQDL